MFLRGAFVTTADRPATFGSLSPGTGGACLSGRSDSPRASWPSLQSACRPRHRPDPPFFRGGNCSTNMKRLEAFIEQIFTDCLLCTRCWEPSHEQDGKYPCSHGAREEHTQNQCLSEVDKGSEVKGMKNDGGSRPFEKAIWGGLTEEVTFHQGPGRAEGTAWRPVAYGQ